MNKWKVLPRPQGGFTLIRNGRWVGTAATRIEASKIILAEEAELEP